MKELKLAILVCNDKKYMKKVINTLIPQTTNKIIKDKKYTHGHAYEYYKSNGICFVCHKAKVEKGKSRCSMCLEKCRKYQKNKKKLVKKV